MNLIAFFKMTLKPCALKHMAITMHKLKQLISL